jgi:hypothetical protein
MPKRIVSYPGGIEGLHLMCNSPNCPSKDAGMTMMENPGTNKSTFKCPDCGCTVVVGVIEGEELLVGVCMEESASIIR